jgi:hypothetical protein
VEFNLDGLPDNAVNISGLCGEDGRIVELNAVSLADTVFSYGQLVRTFYFIVFLCCMHWLLVTANVIPSSLNLVTLMMEALHSSETLVLTSAMWRNILEYGILHTII